MHQKAASRRARPSGQPTLPWRCVIAAGGHALGQGTGLRAPATSPAKPATFDAWQSCWRALRHQCPRRGTHGTTFQTPVHAAGLSRGTMPIHDADGRAPTGPRSAWLRRRLGCRWRCCWLLVEPEDRKTWCSRRRQGVAERRQLPSVLAPSCQGQAVRPAESARVVCGVAGSEVERAGERPPRVRGTVAQHRRRCLPPGAPAASHRRSRRRSAPHPEASVLLCHAVGAGVTSPVQRPRPASQVRAEAQRSCTTQLARLVHIVQALSQSRFGWLVAAAAVERLPRSLPLGAVCPQAHPLALDGGGPRAALELGSVGRQKLRRRPAAPA